MRVELWQRLFIRSGMRNRERLRTQVTIKIMIKINEEGRIPKDELKLQMAAFYKAQGIELPTEVLDYTCKLVDAFIYLVREGSLCNECKQKLYEATEKE